MKHVGICTQDGPEEKTGEIRFQISALSSRLDATLLVEGIACSYSAGPSDPYSGMMACADRRSRSAQAVAEIVLPAVARSAPQTVRPAMRRRELTGE